MESLVEKEFWILPKPKYFDITPDENVITLSSLWAIYVNKFRIRDNALLLSSKFNKHFNTFLNSIPIRDSTLDEKWGENHYIAIITPESDYERKIKHTMNEMLGKHLTQFDKILNSCCFDLYPNHLKSKLALDESYYIDISKGAIWIISTTPRGFYYGIQSVIQIIEHTIFQLETPEKYITLPKMRVVDFPKMKYRGIFIDLNTFTPSFNALTESVPFLVKYKLNNLVLFHRAGFPYSEEEEKEFRDLCNFHHIQLSLISNLDEINTKRVKIVQYHADDRYILPDFQMTLEKIAKNAVSLHEEQEGLLLSSPRNWNCPLDLLLFYLPLVSEVLLNPLSLITEKWWDHVMKAAHLNLFESSLNQETTYDFTKMVHSTTGNFNDSSILKSIDIPLIESLSGDLKDMREKAYENVHFIDILEWGFKSWVLTLKILKMQDFLATQESEIKNNEDIIKKIEEYKQTYQKLIPQAIKLLELSDRVQKGACEHYFQSHTSHLKKLMESWIPQILQNLKTT
ncbi:MAG: glycoside hydrolase family 20 zincin-like fold domain-containing protein [Promethearchaeota archaeon]